MRRRLVWSVVIAVSPIALVACAAAQAGSERAAVTATVAPTSPAATPPLPRITAPVAAGATVEGLLDVDGHDLYARCSGSGGPTVVYFTGWAPDPSKRGVAAVRAIETAVQGKHRVCSYERRNTGRSETVAGTQRPEDLVADVDGVLHGMGETGPFVLLGASFGGLVAGAYAVAHPDRTAGVLLLDASIPDDYRIDQRAHFTGMCSPPNRSADANQSLERIDNCRLAKWAYDRRDREPAVPLVYLAAADASERGSADDDLRKAFVHRWSPGIWTSVEAPHWMDEAAPDLVVRNLERVIELARRS